MTEERKQTIVSEQATEEAAGEASQPIEQAEGVSWFNRHLRYSNAYTWLLLMSALDIMLTWVILYFRGSEVNPIADWILGRWALNGIIVYKFTLILVFIFICEIVGTLRDTTGRSLSRVSVMIAAFPVVWSMFLLARHSGLIG